MEVVDIYRQYFPAICNYNGIQRNAVLVTLTSTSDSGMIGYEVTVTFFPHKDAEDFCITYDAYASKQIYYAKGRRSKKREAMMLEVISQHANELAEQFQATIDWNKM